MTAYKIGVHGAKKAGKTSLCNRLSFGSFVDEYTPTIGLELALAKTENSRLLFIEHGDFSFGGSPLTSFRNIDMCLIVYNLTDENTFGEKDRFIGHSEYVLNEVKRFNRGVYSAPRIIYVGTHIDLGENAVGGNVGENWKKLQKHVLGVDEEGYFPSITTYQVSSKEGNGIQQLLDDLLGIDVVEDQHVDVDFEVKGEGGTEREKQNGFYFL